MASKGCIHCTCRINLQKWKHRFKLIESLANPDDSNTAPQALIDGANIWTATWLYNIILSENLAFWILNDRNSRHLNPRILKLEVFELQDAKIESRVSSINLLLSSTVECFSLFLNLGIFWMSKKTIIIEFGFPKIWRILQIEEGVIHLPRSAEFCRLRRVLSTFLDLQNSSYPTQPHLIIANYYNKIIIINSAWLIIIKNPDNRHHWY